MAKSVRDLDIDLGIVAALQLLLSGRDDREREALLRSAFGEQLLVRHRKGVFVDFGEKAYKQALEMAMGELAGIADVVRDGTGIGALTVQQLRYKAQVLHTHLRLAADLFKK